MPDHWNCTIIQVSVTEFGLSVSKLKFTHTRYRNIYQFLISLSDIPCKGGLNYETWGPNIVVAFF
jgi:hypothetical protein